MAPRDYARRGKPPARKKKTTTNQRSRQPVRQRRPWLLIILTVVLLGGFIWGLMQLTSHRDKPEAPTVNTPAQTTTPKPKKTPAKPSKDALPPPPKETWQYIDVLENKEVQVQVPERKKSDHKYQMQCASFREQSQAEAMKATIAFQGLQSQVKRTEGDNGVWYRVVIGPYDHKRQAEHDRHNLDRNGIHTCQIWYWQP